MNRQTWRFLLTLVLLLALLIGLAHVLPPAQTSEALTVLVLRPGEGNAVLVTCGGQTLLLPLGDSADMEALADYLSEQRLLRVSHIVCPGKAPLPAALTARLSGAAVTLLTAEAGPIALGGGICRVRQSSPGALTLSITHGENRLLLRLSQTVPPELTLNGQSPATLQTDRHSVCIISDGVGVTTRPDFAAWDD